MEASEDASECGAAGGDGTASQEPVRAPVPVLTGDSAEAEEGGVAAVVAHAQAAASSPGSGSYCSPAGGSTVGSSDWSEPPSPRGGAWRERGSSGSGASGAEDPLLPNLVRVVEGALVAARQHGKLTEAHGAVEDLCAAAVGVSGAKDVVRFGRQESLLLSQHIVTRGADARASFHRTPRQPSAARHTGAWRSRRCSLTASSGGSSCCSASIPGRWWSTRRVSPPPRRCSSRSPAPSAPPTPRGCARGSTRCSTAARSWRTSRRAPAAD